MSVLHIVDSDLVSTNLLRWLFLSTPDTFVLVHLDDYDNLIVMVGDEDFFHCGGNSGAPRDQHRGSLQHLP
jgi:hypothetical protein